MAPTTHQTDPRELPEQVRRVLARAHVLHLATGAEHVAPLFFAPFRDGVVWVSSPEAEHSRNLVAHGAAAASIAPEAPPIADFSGLQLRGVLDEDHAPADLARAYLARHPEAAPFVRGEHRTYFLRITWARWIERVRHQVRREEWCAP